MTKARKPKPAKKLTHQSSSDWLRMAGQTLAGAAQMAWQSPDEIDANRVLFERVTGGPTFDHPTWRRSLTWSGAVLLGLSTEQSLKALKIASSEDRSCLKTHDLAELWSDLMPEIRQGIDLELYNVRVRASGTTLGSGTLGAEEIVQIHPNVFEAARYNSELKTGEPYFELTHNIELWQLALSSYLCAQRLITRT